MKEIREIVAAYDLALAQGRQTALATVVQVHGSAYRRPGARMLVTEYGQLTGAISGGCLEGDVLRKARLVMQQKKAKLVTYDTTDEEDALSGVGLGCNGVIHILLEPVDPQNPVNPVELLRKILAQRQNAVIVTLFSLHDQNACQWGTSLLLLQSGAMAGNVCGQIPANKLLSDVDYVMKQHTHVFVNYGEHDAFIEFIPPCVSLVIIGAGNDVMPLVQIAGILGWDITLVDGRPHYASPERFPSVKKIITTKPQNMLRHITIDENTACALMTHNYNYDLTALQELMTCNVNYIGVLGPKKKLERMLNDLGEKGIMPGNEQSGNLYGPAGLDIGAETPEEIAVSIVAEIRAIMSAKSGKSLKNKKMPIHSL